MIKYFIIFLVTLNTFAASSEIYKIAGKFYPFNHKEKLLIHGQCLKGCIAYTRSKAIKKFKRVKDPSANFDMSLGSYICKNIIFGKSVMGIDTNKDMKAFCYFDEDQSMVELNSLEAYAKVFQAK